jgi:hypothetical protein
MAIDPIDTSFEQIDVSQLIPSFFKYLFGGALNSGNGGYFGIGLQMIIAFVSLLIFKPYGLDRAMVTSGLITVLVSALLLKAGWINNFMLTIAIIYLGFGVWRLYAERSQEEA